MNLPSDEMIEEIAKKYALGEAFEINKSLPIQVLLNASFQVGAQFVKMYAEDEEKEVQS